MRVMVRRSTIEGETKAPPSKSYTHRALVCGLLSKGTTKVTNPLICDDTLATINACRLMGATVEQNDALEIRGPVELSAPSKEIDCHGSGTTLRIFTALAALTKGKCNLTGDKSLQLRPIGDLLDGLRQLGITAQSIDGNGTPPLIVQGSGLTGGHVKIRGDVSSQYITGLLFACSRGSGDTRIDLTTNLESRPYVEMTMWLMKQFGVEAAVSKEWRRIDVSGPQEYRCPEYNVEGDYSSAAFLLAAGVLAGRTKVSGLNTVSLQADAGFIEILQNMGASVRKTVDSIAVERSNLLGIEIDASQTPDIIPVVSVLSTQAKGITTIRNAGRLKFKESDRISSVSQELRKMGASIQEFQDGFKITGPTPLRGAILNPHDDHRVAMAGVIAGLIADGTTIIENIDCVTKSYPDFIHDMKKIGSHVTVEGGMD